MNYEEITVNQLFRNRKMTDNQHPGIESTGKVVELKKALSQKKPQIGTLDFSGKILEKAPELLNIKLKDVLASAWLKHQQVEQCLEQSKKSPDETFLVPLIDHTVTSEHHPQVEISVDGVSLGKVDFKILLKLELKGIILKIKGDKIEGVKAGSCQCKASLTCEGIPVFDDQSEAWEF